MLVVEVERDHVRGDSDGVGSAEGVGLAHVRHGAGVVIGGVDQEGPGSRRVRNREGEVEGLVIGVRALAGAWCENGHVLEQGRPDCW